MAYTPPLALDHYAPTPPQEAFLVATDPDVLWHDGNQIGKALREDTPVLTPTGWAPIKDLHVGAEVIAGDGSITKVTAVMPQGERPVYELAFDDGAWVIADVGHMWKCKAGEQRRRRSPRYGQWGALSTEEIYQYSGEPDKHGAVYPKRRQRIAIPVPGTKDDRKVDLPLDPYVLGVLLGDGSLTHAVRLTSADPELAARVAKRLPPGDSLTKHKARYAYGVIGGATYKALDEMHALHGSEAKFVPTRYLHAGASQRLEILRGLMDTDGTCSKAGSASFTSISHQLALDVQELVRSLGGKARIASRYTRWGPDKKLGKRSYCVGIQAPHLRLFHLERKAKRQCAGQRVSPDRLLVSIKKLGKAPTVCIEVAHPEHTFVVRDYIVTLNSVAMAADAVHTALGTHPYKPNIRVPNEQILGSYSFAQMEPLMRKIHDLIPPGVTDASYAEGKGYIGRPPIIVFNNGSKITFFTYEQGAARVAGATVAVARFDEPPPEQLHGEIQPRLFRMGGDLRTTMTPTPDMPDQTWNKKRVDNGELIALNHHVTEEACWPRGWVAPWKWQEEIDKYAEKLNSAERDMRIKGWWYAMSEGRLIENFSRADHEYAVTLEQMAEEQERLNLGRWYLAIGCDHGTVDGKQAATLVAILGRHTLRPRVVFLDSVTNEGLTAPEHDAQDIIDMLGRLGLGYDDIDAWTGDVPTGSDKYDVQKSNKDLRRELARILGRRPREIARFKTPRKRRGSVLYGCRVLNALFGRLDKDGTPHARVHPRCEGLMEFFEQFDGHPKHPTKDVGDSGRYPVESALKHRIRWNS